MRRTVGSRRARSNVNSVGARGIPVRRAPVAGTNGRRPATTDRAFKVIALVAGLCLIGFILYVAVRPAAKSSRTLGIAALQSPPPAMLKPGTVAPAFSLPRLGGGPSVSLSSLRGTPVIVNFFASWCPHCRSELAAVGTVAAANSGHIAVIGVDSNDGTGAAAAKLLAAAHAAYPVGLDTSATVASRYLLTALPVTYFLNAEGRVVGSALGAQTLGSLQRWVARLTSPS
jgi:thiol-disulfide isomerase/thioredoxin